MARRIIGPDVSFYQDDPATPQEIDFARMNQAADFVIIRAGQNLWVDSDFKNNWRRAKEAGLPRGSYWFYDSRGDPKQQADLWFNLLSGDLGELPLFLDLEEAYRGPFTGWQHWKTFLDRIKTLVGSKDVGIYTAYYYWNNNAPLSQPTELEYFHRYPLWIANYGVSEPLVPKPWSASEWLFWQFTSSGDGSSYGAESLEIDLDYFNGDAQAFAKRFNVPVPGDPVPPNPSGNQYRVNAGSLYVREGPGTNFKSVGYLLRNEIVEALETNADGSWLRVRRISDGLTGWASSTYLVRIMNPPPPPPTPTGDLYRFTATSLYVREAPDKTSKTVGYLKRNDIVEALEFSADHSWMRIRRLTDGLIGWASTTYLEKISPTPPPPPPPPAGDKYRVTASRLYIREGPGTNFPSPGYLEFNEVVISLAVNEDGTWRQIRRSDGLIGWASARYLIPVPPPPPPDPNEPPPDTVTGNWYRLTGRLNVREGPGTNFNVVGYLSKDEAVEALNANPDQGWIRFRRVDGWTAWASSSYLTNLGKAPASVMQKIFPGVTYYRNERASPRRMVSYVLEIDTRSEGIRFLVTPALRDPFPQLCTRTTSQFLDDHDMQIAINGDAFYYLDPAQYPPQNYCPDGGDPARLVGFAASRGDVYNSHKEPSRPILYINQNNEITIDDPKGKIYNAVSGERVLVTKGKKVIGLDTQQLHPRTALGMNQNGRWLYLVVIDGREYSIGATYSELADLLISYGMYTAMSFDGGGSSTMVIEGIDKRPRVLNTPVNDNMPGKERAVANHLGISLKK
ncbi:MAG TPA: SH3 domain-containing protein [Anaerolineales bacterium]|nr:SH3 domain-containing protein [Anaerolineales bacterium]